MKKAIVITILVLFGALTAAPLVFLVCGSLMGSGELAEYLAPVLESTKGYARWRLFPLYPTLRNLVELCFDSPEFFQMFWNTMKITAGILAGQLVFGLPSAWGLARYPIPGKRFFLPVIYSAYDVTVSGDNALAISGAQSVASDGYDMGSHCAGGVFYLFGISYVPLFLRNTGRTAGSSKDRWCRGMEDFWAIGVPLGSSGIFSALVLQFLECFSMIEQPLVFLHTKKLWPLSLYLPEIKEGQTGFALCCSLVALLPALCVFGMGQQYLELGITAAAVKE